MGLLWHDAVGGFGHVYCVDRETGEASVSH